MSLTKPQTKALHYLINRASAEDLEAMLQAYKDRKKAAEQEDKSSVRPGAKVKFLVGKSGQTLRGTVQKINRKTIAVKTADGQNFRVQPELVQPATAKSA